MKMMLTVTRQVTFLLVVVGLLISMFLIARPLAKNSQQDQDTPNNEKEITQLIAILRDKDLQKSDPRKVVQAIERIAELQANDAIDALTKLLTFRRTFESENLSPDMEQETHPITPAGRYPALGALMEIGRKSLPALTEVLKEEEVGSLASNNAIEAILFFFREEPSEGIQYFESTSTMTPAPLVAQRMSHVTEKIKDYAKMKEALDKKTKP